jgi:hypothetical protein
MLRHRRMKVVLHLALLLKDNSNTPYIVAILKAFSSM